MIAALLLLMMAEEVRESSKFLLRRSQHGRAGRDGATKRLAAVEAARAMKPAPGFDGTWRSIGPRPTIVLDNASGGGPPIASGRVTSVSVAPGGIGDVVYIGAAHGGIWKTVDAGRMWTPLGDQLPTLAIGSVTVDPADANVIYAGTGEENFKDVENYFGLGVLKSVDAGASWRLLASKEFTGARIGAITVQGQTLFAAVQAGPGRKSGIWRSADGGETWTNVLTGAPGASVVTHPTDTKVVYAALGSQDAGRANGIYKSVDGGTTWARVEKGLPKGVGRIALTIAASRPDTLYAAVVDGASGNPAGVFKSMDAGASWTNTNVPDYCAKTCWWANAIQVSPTDPDLVLVGGFQVYITRTGGKTWFNISEGANGNVVHWDVHSIVFGPQGGRVWVGSDGGVYTANGLLTTHPRDIGWDNVNDTLAITQFYPGCSLHEESGAFLVCGTQDNGSQVFTGGSTWRMIGGGDGGFTAIDPTRPSVYYFAGAGTNTIYKSSPFTSFKGFLQVTSGIDDVDTDPCFVPPLAIDPSDPLRLYWGCAAVYETRDGGGAWKRVSPELADGDAYVSLAVSPAKPGRVYGSTSEHGVLMTEGDGRWENRSRGLPKRPVSSVTAHPSNPDVAYATLLGFGDPVFQTVDAGRTWKSISGNLPNVPANVLLLDPQIANSIFLGTDAGVFHTSDNGQTWARMGEGLPLTSVVDLDLGQNGFHLYAATHGRGMWVLELQRLLQVRTAIRLDSADVVPGSPARVRVAGTGFGAKSVIRWNGEDRPTTPVQRFQLEATLKPSDLTGAGRAVVTLVDATTGFVTRGINVETGGTPVIRSVQNAAHASGGGIVQLSGGTLATIRGSNLAALTASRPLEDLGQTLAGAVVEFRDTVGHRSYLAPLLFVSPEQINFQVPWDVPVGTDLALDVVQGSRMSEKVSVTIDKFAPGLFSVNQQGTGQGTVFAVSDGKRVDAKRPAAKGELIRIVATGLGPYWEEPKKGPQETIATPSVTIGGRAAEVVKSEARQPFAGLYDVTVRVPATVAAGGAVPVRVTTGKIPSNVVTIAVR